MKERAINISSVNTQKIGKSSAEDFVTKFNPILKLENDMKHEMAIDNVSMTYSWHNIRDQYKNNNALTAAFSLAFLEIRSRNEEAINSTQKRIYSLKVFYFLLYRRRYLLLVSELIKYAC